MQMKYRHLTSEDRTVIKALLQENISCAKIAENIGVHRSTIYREIRRNSGKRGYRSRQANNIAIARKCKPRTKKLDGLVIAYIINALQLKFSPEQISGITHKYTGVCISHELIYQLIYKDKKSGGTLYSSLRINNKRKYKRRCKATDNRGRIRNAVSIEKRPKVINDRKRYGDWEADLVCGAGRSGYLVTLVERKSGFGKIGYVKNKTSNLVYAEIVRLLSPYKVHSITYDNGKEFACHEDVNKALGCKSYFCHAYSSWERGSNENFNGLLRQYYPKSMRLDKVTIFELQAVENEVNSRPRKRLRFSSPSEVYKRAC